MKNQLQEKLSLFVENAQDIKSGFFMQNPMTKRLAALIYTLETKHMDDDAIKESHAMLKDQTGFFSYFRGNLSIYISASLSLTENREQRLTDTLAVYDLLKVQNFHASDYLAAASYQIAANAESGRYRQIVDRSRGFYDAMKANHFFYTGQDDYIYAAMLGLSDIDVDAGSEKMERLYQNLKPDFFDKNSIQALAQVLVLGGETDESLTNVYLFRDALRNRNIKLDKTYTLPSLGVLSMLTSDADTASGEIAEAKDILREQKGFGAFSVEMQELLLYVVSIVCSLYANDIKNGIIKATVSTSVASLIIAQEAAMAAAFAASSAATAAAASSH